MKEAADLLRDLLATLEEAGNLVTDMDEFELKNDVIVTIDSAWNEISYQLSALGSSVQ